MADNGPAGKLRPLLAAAIAAIALVVALSYAVVVTDQPSFCAGCHEMKPFFVAWQAGKHRTVGCIECHVDAGFPARMAHKTVALWEVYVHFLGRPRFPVAGVSVPNYRCLPCHRDVRERPGSLFSHRQHTKSRCQECHPTPGHAVTLAALSAAGALAPGATDASLTEVGIAGVGGAGPAGHLDVTCFPCHNARAPCALCHQPGRVHGNLGPCDDCHRPSPTFAFAHRDIPGHTATQYPCAQCHPNGFKSARCACHGPTGTFAHPPAGEHGYRELACLACHPNGQVRAVCTCHRNGVPMGD